MSRFALNGHPATNAMLLLAVAAGCGWLLYTQTKNPAALRQSVRDLRRNLQGGLNGAGQIAEAAIEQVRHYTGRQPPPRVAQRRMMLDEPMAGYGA